VFFVFLHAALQVSSKKAPESHAGETKHATVKLEETTKQETV
jgi:hypothetical protein